MHQLDTFWFVMQAIASERVRDNTVLTRRVERELRRCAQAEAIFPGKVVTDQERRMDGGDIYNRFQHLSNDTNLRVGVLNVFYDAVAFYISHKSDRLADGLVATKMVELVNRFRATIGNL
jgi:hypothetical protein